MYICQVVFFVEEKDHGAYYISFIIITFIGLFFAIMNLIKNLIGFTTPWEKPFQQIEQKLTCIQSSKYSCLQASFMQKLMNALMNYSSVEEFLLLLLLIFSLYGFINEKSWMFENAIAGFNFILLLFTITSNVWYNVCKLIYLKTIISRSYDKYFHNIDILKDKMFDQKKKTVRLPKVLYIMIPFAFMKAVNTYLMLSITSVRIYVDNFALERNASEPESTTGNYKTSSFTCFMIFCDVFLPSATEIAFIIVNKYSFFEVYSLIKQIGNKEIHVQSISGWIKLLGSVRDLFAYISAIIVMLLFIAFAVGTFLPDYDHSEFDIPNGAKTAAKVLGAIFIILFVLSNFHVVILFSIAGVLLISSIPVGMCLFASKIHECWKGCDSSKSSPYN